MFKKMLAIPLLCISMVFFVQCSKDVSDPDTNNYSVKKGPGSGGGGGGGGEESATNNLSFPVFAMDGFTITQIQSTSFLFPYTGPYTGLSAEELAALGEFDWYAQKVTGNNWQAEFSPKNEPTEVTFVDWGDVLESVNPKIGTPTRIELTLYKDVSDDPMTGYTMALLAFPSSKDETQGTNTETYAGNWATLVSSAPKLVIQFLSVPTTELTWTGTMWTGADPPATGFGFAPELNVGGKYIFGASTGGWKPTVAGVYRITFYIPTVGSNILLTDETGIGNYPGNTNDGQWIIPTEGGAGKPVVDWDNNLTYVDVTATGGGSGGGGKGGGGEKP
ncbi:MAG: hypothetical protein WC780_04435 [Lentimicrobiaceae bacterium]|jgi:hypothetical protein